MQDSNFIYYKNTIAVTNRHLCTCPLTEQLKKVCSVHPRAIILREKDLSEDAYLQLARQCQQAVESYGVPLIPNQYVAVARALQLKQIQVSFPLFADNYKSFTDFERVWVSVHSREEAWQAEQWGAGALIAGHIFATACKKDVAPRGLEFLQQICENVSIPVYAIGGINAKTYPLLQQSGVAGACVMSQSMTQENFFWQIG